MTTGARVLVAVWCCSVGSTWTVELYELDPSPPPGMLVDWISSGVPTSQPEPNDTVARELLAGSGLHLYRDSAVGPCTPSRHSIGYACVKAEVIALAHQVRDAATAAGAHPVLLAAQRWRGMSSARSFTTGGYPRKQIVARNVSRATP